MGKHLGDLDNIIGKNKAWFAWTVSSPSNLPPLAYAPSTVKAQANLADVQKAVPNHSIFYMMAHGRARNPLSSDPGDYGFMGIAIWDPTTGKTDYVLQAADVSSKIGANEYNLVYLNSCAGGDDSEGARTGYVNAFKAKNYVSWNFAVSASSAADAAKQFFTNLDGGNKVSAAVIGCKAHKVVGFMAGGAGTGDDDLTTFEHDDSVIIDRRP
jgi:hypothetical protein